jgi:hypothetical protein
MRLWRMRLAGNLAQRTMGPSWTALQEFDQVLPDLKLMRDVAQHIDEYGRDGDNRRHSNPTTGQRVGRRSLHVMSLGDWSFNWLGGTIDFDAPAKPRTRSYQPFTRRETTHQKSPQRRLIEGLTAYIGGCRPGGSPRLPGSISRRRR